MSSSHQWRAGDLAQCIDDKPLAARQRMLIKRGTIYCVLATGTIPEHGIGLSLEGLPKPNNGKSKGLYLATRFIPITKADDAFIEQVRNLKLPSKLDA